jgi:hypothetical protein
VEFARSPIRESLPLDLLRVYDRLLFEHQNGRSYKEVARVQVKRVAGPLGGIGPD